MAIDENEDYYNSLDENSVDKWVLDYIGSHRNPTAKNIGAAYRKHSGRRVHVNVHLRELVLRNVICVRRRWCFFCTYHIRTADGVRAVLINNVPRTFSNFTA